MSHWIDHIGDMKPITRLLASMLFVSCLLNACSGSQPAGQTDAQKLAATLSGDDQAAAANNPLCKLFTRAEIAKYLGETVSAGRNAGMGTGCQWPADDDSGDVIVQIVPSRYHSRPSAMPGFKELAVGTRGFVSPEGDGWTAGAIVGTDAIVVSVEGAAASEANTVALLKDTIERHAP